MRMDAAGPVGAAVLVAAPVIAPYIEVFSGKRTLPVTPLKPPPFLRSTSPTHGVVAVSFVPELWEKW